MRIPAENHGSLYIFKAGDGMIYIYTDKKNCSGWIMQNDWYFNLYTSSREFTDEDRAVVWQIDHAKLSGDKRIETKYGTGTVRNLSSGCKTLLNVRKNPGKVVNADECGKECAGHPVCHGRHFLIYDTAGTGEHTGGCQDLL